MLIMSLNIKGIGKPSRKLALGHLRDLHKPDIVLIPKTMGEGSKIIKDLAKSWRDWVFKLLIQLGDLRGY